MASVPTQPESASQRGQRVLRVGRVVTDSRDKTIKVVSGFTTKHRMYGKFIRRSTTLHVHDERNEAHVGDLVEVMACRRLSKTKCWRLVRVIERAA